MTGSPAELFSDTDLLAYEQSILTQFGVANWQAKRTKAVEDWLWPVLRAKGLDPVHWRTRVLPDAILTLSSSTYTAQANQLIPVGSICASSAAHLYIGASEPFRALSVRLADGTVASTPTSLDVQVWADRWTSTSATDASSGFALGGGTVSWTVPDGWTLRDLGTEGPYYWARLGFSEQPDGLIVDQIACVRRSVLSAPAALRTLALIFREAPAGQEGPWREKAEWYAQEADAALSRALPLVGGEFDTDTEDDVIDTTEQAQTTEEASSSGGYAWERA